MKVSCSVNIGSSSLRTVVKVSFHWLSWMDPHLCRAGHTSYFLPAGEKKDMLFKMSPLNHLQQDIKTSLLNCILSIQEVPRTLPRVG